jgi:hypothetical protein
MVLVERCFELGPNCSREWAWPCGVGVIEWVLHDFR